MQPLQESVSRHCHFYKATNGKWYLELASYEYGDVEDAITYGPFQTEDAAMDHLNNFANPGSYSVDESGSAPPPTHSPNGSPVERPVGHSQWGGSRWGGPLYGQRPGAQASPARSQPTAAGAARLTASLGLGKASAPETRPSPAKTPGEKPYKIYGGQRRADGSSTGLSTRVKSTVYVPAGTSKFKKGQQANARVERGELVLTDPATGHSQRWKAFETLLRAYVQAIVD